MHTFLHEVRQVAGAAIIIAIISALWIYAEHRTANKCFRDRDKKDES